MKPKITKDGLELQSFSEAFTEYTERLKEIYGQDIDLGQNTPDGQRAGIIPYISQNLQQLAAQIYNDFDPDLASDKGMIKLAKLTGTYRQPASRSQWDLKVTAARSITLPAQYTVKDELGQEWVVPQDTSLPLGEHTVTFLAKEWGSVNGELGDITPVTIVLGVTGVAADTASAVGRDEETLTEWRVRRNRSLEGAGFTTRGALFSRVLNVSGVKDANVIDNDTDVTDSITGVPPHGVAVVVEGGSVADITEVVAKYKGGGRPIVGDITSTYTEQLVRPNGSTFDIFHVIKFSRPDYVDVHVKLVVSKKKPTDDLDIELIKRRIAEREFIIGEPLQAGELYAYGYKAADNFVLYDMEVSRDAGNTWTDQQISTTYREKFLIDVANITVTGDV